MKPEWEMSEKRKQEIVEGMNSKAGEDLYTVREWVKELLDALDFRDMENSR